MSPSFFSEVPTVTQGVRKLYRVCTVVFNAYAALTCFGGPVVYDGTAAEPGHGLDPQV
jgi:hypothetical protein